MKKWIILVVLAAVLFSTIACLSPEYQHLNKGDKYSEKGQWDNAITEYNSALEVNPDLLEALFNRGTAYVEKGMYDKGIEDYSRVIELDPENTLAYWQRSTAYIHNRQYEEAITDCLTTLDMGMQSHFIYKNLGIASANMGRYDDAIAYFRKAQQISSSPEFDNEMDQCISTVHLQMQTEESE